MKELEELHQEIISNFNIVTTESHVSRFADSLVAAFNNLEKRSVENKVVVCFKRGLLRTNKSFALNQL